MTISNVFKLNTAHLITSRWNMEIHDNAMYIWNCQFTHNIFHSRLRDYFHYNEHTVWRIRNTCKRKLLPFTPHIPIIFY